MSFLSHLDGVIGALAKARLIVIEDEIGDRIRDALLYK